MQASFLATTTGRTGSHSADGASPAEAPALTFDAVYDAEFDYVYRLVARLAGQGHVEDLVQEVFAVVHLRLVEFRGEALLTTWLFRIAYRVVGAHIRRERLRRRVLELFKLEAAGAEHATSVDTLEAKHVRGALDVLSFEKRTALILFEVEGWSCEEIASATEVPVGTVYTRLHHAKKEFKKAYLRRTGKEPA